MRIRKRYLFGVLTFATIGFLVACAFWIREPIVNGRPLGYWCDQFEVYNLSESPEDLRSAMDAMDDRCIRALIRELNRRRSPALERFHDWMDRVAFQPTRWPPYRPASAALMLGALGSRATKAIPSLEKAARFRSRPPFEGVDVRGSAIAALILIRHDPMDAYARGAMDPQNPMSADFRYAICRLGTNAAPCVPFFVEALQTTNITAKAHAAQALGRIHSRPEIALPALVSVLNETNHAHKLIAIFALQQFGAQAKPAWNNVAGYLNDTTPSVRIRAGNTLWAIDPEAAQKLGVSQPAKR